MNTRRDPAWFSRRCSKVGRLLVLGFALSLMLSWNAMGQEQTRSVRYPSQQPVAASPELGIGDLYAVVVGVSKYRHPQIAKLTLADKDARDFAAFLGTQRELFRQIHLTLLVNEQATQQEISRHLLSELRVAGKNDTVVLFFAGHGADDPNKPGDFFFLAYDSDPKTPEATAINMSGSKFMERLDSKRVLLIADACHAGGFASIRTRSTEPSLQRFMRQMKETEGRLVLSASRADEVSIEKTQMMNGVFTYYLLEGLKGAADSNRDGVVTVQELYEYVYEKTKDNTKGIQHPQLGGEVVGRFPMSLVSLQPPAAAAVGPPKPSTVPQPINELDYLRRQAESYDARAQFELGLKYEYGLGVPKDKAEALKWYFKASEQGNGDAKGALARLSPTTASVSTTPRNVKRDPSKDVPLLEACKAGNLDEVKRLLSEGANPGARDKEGSTPLHFALESDASAEIVQLLLDRGAYVDARTQRESFREYTPLHMAALWGRGAAIQLLLNRGADMKLKTQNGTSVLALAAMGSDDTSTVGLLLDRGARANHAAMTNALLNAVLNCRTDVALLLAAQGAEPKRSTDVRGVTALQYACRCHGSTPELLELLSKGSNIDTRDKEGKTALHWAAEHGTGANPRQVEWLLDHGAAINAKDKKGKTPLDSATEKYSWETEEAYSKRLENNREIVRILKDHHGKLTSSSGAKSRR